MCRELFPCKPHSKLHFTVTHKMCGQDVWMWFHLGFYHFYPKQHVMGILHKTISIVYINKV